MRGAGAAKVLNLTVMEVECYSIETAETETLPGGPAEAVYPVNCPGARARAPSPMTPNRLPTHAFTRSTRLPCLRYELLAPE